MKEKQKPLSFEETGLPQNPRLKRAFAIAQKHAMTTDNPGFFYTSHLPITRLLAKNVAAENVEQVALLPLLLPYSVEKYTGNMAAAFGQQTSRNLRMLRGIFKRQKTSLEDLEALSVPARCFMLATLLSGMEQELDKKEKLSPQGKWAWLMDRASKFRALMPSDPQLDLLGAGLFEAAGQKLGLDIRFYFAPDGKICSDGKPPAKSAGTAPKYVLLN